MSHVLVTGLFNVVRAEHVRMFKWASAFGPVTVAVFNDHSEGVEAPLLDRVEVLRACKYVHEVVVVRDEQEAIRRVRPAYLALGGGWRGRDIPWQELLDELRVRVVIHNQDMKEEPARPKATPAWSFTDY